MSNSLTEEQIKEFTEELGLTKEQIIEYNAEFKAYDADRDGTITSIDLDIVNKVSSEKNFFKNLNCIHTIH